MKKILSFFVAAFIATSTFAQIDADLVIKKGVDIEINGLEDDAIWALIDPVAIDKPFNPNPANPLAGELPTLGEPGDTYFKMFYTDNYIYVLVNVVDDVHYPHWMAGGNQGWLYDKVELYFNVNDVLQDGGSPQWVAGHQDPGHYQYAPSIANEGDYDLVLQPVDGNMGNLSGKAYWIVTRQGEGYIMEFKIPIHLFSNDTDGDSFTADKLVALPQGMGFDVTVVDNDNDGNGRNRMVWMNDGPTESYNNMDNVGVVVFSEELLVTPTNISENRMSSLRVYPNPAQNLVTIDANVDKIEVVNITGRLVMVIENSRTVNVSELPAGLYIFKSYENGSLNGVTKVTKR
jgi:hypothetical protein